MPGDSDLVARRMSCFQRVSNFLASIERQKSLNAFLSVYDKEALDAAALVDEKIAQGKAGKLAGLTIGIKDVFAYKNHRLQAASKILQNYSAPYNSTVVERLLKEDAIIIGSQNCDEFAMGSSNENSAFGPCLNPFNHECVPGGSSGGSAAAVSADMCDISIGSDTGGSVRQPAAFCGIYGLKPTYSRISRYGLTAYASSFDCVGILGKSIESMAKTLEVISGADEFDSTVSRRAVPSFAAGDLTKKYKIAYFKNQLNSPVVQTEINDQMLAFIEDAKRHGHLAEGVEFSYDDYILPAYYILATAEASSNLSRFDGVRYGYRASEFSDLTSFYKKSRSQAFGKEVQRRILLGTFVLSASYYDAYYKQAQRVRRLIRNQVKDVFKKYDLILQPATPTTAFKLNEHTADPLEMYAADLFSVLANVAGIPALSTPAGKDKKGLPIGLQFLADDFQEETLLNFSRILDAIKKN